MIATGNKEQMDAAGQQFTVLSGIIEKLPKQLDEIESQIARGREALLQALQVLATQS